MPKRPKKKTFKVKGKSGGSGGSNSSYQNQTCVERGRFTSSLTSSGTANTYTNARFGLALSNFGSRAIDFGDIFAEWKLTHLKAHLVIDPAISVTATQAVSYVGAGIHGAWFTPLTTAEYTLPTTFSQTIDFPIFGWGSFGQALHLNVAKKDITTPSKWLLCNSTGQTDLTLYQAGSAGTFSISAQNNAVAALQFSVWDFTIEFKSPTDAALLPMYRGLRFVHPSLRIKEKKQSYDFEVVEEKKK